MEKGDQIFCMEYSGTVKNGDKLLETLGGYQHINDTFSQPNRKLELKFRQEYIFSIIYINLCYRIVHDSHKLMEKFPLSFSVTLEDRNCLLLFLCVFSFPNLILS